MTYQSPRRSMLLNALIHEATETDHALIDQAFMRSLGISAVECVDLRYLVADILRVFVSMPPSAQADLLKHAQEVKMVNELIAIGKQHGLDVSGLEHLNSEEEYTKRRDEMHSSTKRKNAPDADSDL